MHTCLSIPLAIHTHMAAWRHIAPHDMAIWRHATPHWPFDLSGGLPDSPCCTSSCQQPVHILVDSGMCCTVTLDVNNYFVSSPQGQIERRLTVSRHSWMAAQDNGYQCGDAHISSGFNPFHLKWEPCAPQASGDLVSPGRQLQMEVRISFGPAAGGTINTCSSSTYHFPSSHREFLFSQALTSCICVGEHEAILPAATGNAYSTGSKNPGVRTSDSEPRHHRGQTKPTGARAHGPPPCQSAKTIWHAPTELQPERLAVKVPRGCGCAHCTHPLGASRETPALDLRSLSKAVRPHQHLRFCTRRAAWRRACPP